MTSAPRFLLSAWGAAVAALVIVATASAARPATAPELAAMAASRGLDPACMTATVSTVDATWARMQALTSPPATCVVGDGFFLLHLSGGAWRDVEEAGETFPCPAAGVPLAVGRDLGVCRAARTYLLCLPAGSNETLRLPKVRPTACVTLGPQDAFAGAANLARLDWRHWGSATATATGRERGFHLPLENIPVRVVAFRRRVADCGDYVYTRLRVRSRFGTLRQNIPAVCGDSE
jgi:hypothetical protein